jgi:hypothetical protein
MAKKSKKCKVRNTLMLGMLMSKRKGGVMRDRRARRQKDARRTQEMFG